MINNLFMMEIFISMVTTCSKNNRMLGRALIYEQYEASSFIVVELFEPSGPFPDHVKASKRIDIYSNELTGNEYKKLTGESSYGIGPSNIQWDGLTLRYKIGIGRKRFSCVLNGLDENNFDPYCSLGIR